MQKHNLSKDQELRKGDYLISSNGEFKAIFQEDGNFVVYGPCGSIWASNTSGSGAVRVCMQGDCNLVIYDQDDKAVWHTSTYRRSSYTCQLYLTDEGSLVVERDYTDKLWRS